MPWPFRAPARRAARGPAPDRHQGGLRRGRVRRVLRLRRRAPRQLVPHPGAGRRRRTITDIADRGGHGQNAGGRRGAGGVRGAWRGAVRHLHAGHDRHRLLAGGRRRAGGRHAPRADGGQPLPLHRLHENLRRGARVGAPHHRGEGSARRRWVQKIACARSRLRRLEVARTLDEALALAEAPKASMPFAGGTDVMVVLEAGKLPVARYRRFIDLSELAGDRGRTKDAVTLGALTTYREVRTPRRRPPRRRRVPDAGGGRAQSGAHRHPEPRHAGRQHHERLAGRRLAAGAAGVRRGAAARARVAPAAAAGSPTTDFHTGYKQMDSPSPGELRRACASRLPRTVPGGSCTTTTRSARAAGRPSPRSASPASRASKTGSCARCASVSAPSVRRSCAPTSR